jgi:predicted outer membrane repeat protein
MSIQSAIGAASNGDEVRIAPGVYTSGGASVVSISNKSITLSGGYQNGDWSTSVTSTTTIIDGQNTRTGMNISNASVVISYMTVRGGKNNNGGGLSANINTFNTIVAHDMIFANNAATGSGGGLFVVGGNIFMSRSSLVGNTAGEDGGGFYGLSLTLTDGLISGNTAARNAGGASGDQLALERVDVLNNNALIGDGGGLYGAGILTDTQVLNNTAGDSGGGVYSTKINVTRGVFQGNRAEHRPGDDTERVYIGGGLYVGGTATLDGTLIISNTAQNTGGGLYQWDINGRVDISGARFDRNVALQGSGGGLSIGGSAAITGTVILNNRAAVDGGGLAQASPSNGRPLSPISITSSRIEGNTASTGNGGGIFVDDQFKLTSSLVVGNIARMSGGGIYQTDSLGRGHPSSLSLVGAWVGGNRAIGGSGGGINAGSALSIASTQVVSNTAASNGGGVYALVADGLRLTGALLGDNQASSNADGIYIDSPFDSGAASLLNVTIASGKLSLHPAIQMQGTATSLSLVNTAITSHTVGIARATGSTLTGDYNTLFGNSTNQTVGGVAAPLTFAHTVSADPKFVNPPAHDFHLREGSPLISAGDPGRSYAGQRDMDGEVMPVGGRAEIGADEFYKYRAYLPVARR